MKQLHVKVLYKNGMDYLDLAQPYITNLSLKQPIERPMDRPNMIIDCVRCMQAIKNASALM